MTKRFINTAYGRAARKRQTRKGQLAREFFNQADVEGLAAIILPGKDVAVVWNDDYGPAVLDDEAIEALKEAAAFVNGRCTPTDQEVYALLVEDGGHVYGCWAISTLAGHDVFKPLSFDLVDLE